MKKNINVLLVGSDPSVRGGITSVISQFMENKWRSINIELHPTYIENTIINKIIFFIKSYIRYFIKLIKEDIDIVHVHMSYKGSFFRKLLIVRLAKILKKKVIIHLHGSEFEVFYNSANKMLKNNIKYILDISDRVVVLGNKWNDVIKKISDTANIEVFNNAVNISNYSVTWNEKKTNILFLGVLIKRKGIYDLIESINILNKSGIIARNRLNFIIGGSGKEEEEIKKLIYKYKLQDFIEMPGWVDGDLKEILLKKSQIFVLPSYNEGLPMAILESMSYGIPVISTDVGSISEVVINNQTGILIQPGNFEQLANAIEEISDNSENWKIQSDLCKKILKESFDENEYFKQFERLYELVLAT